MATTLGEFKTLVRELSDMENNEFISDEELTQYINYGYQELYDLLVVSFEDYFLQTNTFSLSQTGTTTYTIPENFYKLRGIDKIFGNSADQYIPLYKYNFNERHRYSRGVNQAYLLSPVPNYRIMGDTIFFEPLSSIDGDYKIYYVPKPTDLVDDADEIDQNSDIWKQYIVVDAAIKCITKEESDPSVLLNMKQGLIDRIQKASSYRDAGRPERVGDVLNPDEWNFDRDDWLW